MNFKEKIKHMLDAHTGIKANIPRKSIIQEAVDNKEAMVSANGALAVWTPPESTGRSPQDTMIVRRPESEANIDWTSPNNTPMDPETFQMIFDDAVKTLGSKEKLYYTDRVLGADSTYALPVRTISNRALPMLFTDNMFRPVPEDINKSTLLKYSFTILVLPYDKLDRKKYEGRLRKLPSGNTSNMVIVMDIDNCIGIVYGSAYCGSVKKLMFSVMNYILPQEGILPLHCSANEDKNGSMALFLGLSGTGKTTLSADPGRALLGDDEHMWSEKGIANFENGCYAKLINLNPEKEPEIHKACFHKADYLDHGAIIENAMIYPDGKFDLDDERFTPNSRGSYPLCFLTNINESSVGDHPKYIIFLTADANGVLPPVAKLTTDQAKLWFLMGYTSKLAGTETGVIEPSSTFSRFFGSPFMPRNPGDYIKLLEEKMNKYKTSVYLVNTGWSGGPYGVGKRMDINLTRQVLDAILEGKLDNVEYTEDSLFHIMVPKSCDGVPPEILNPQNTWTDKGAYTERAEKLSDEFKKSFDKSYGSKNIDKKVAAQCPGC
ncbi:MAG: phosphoenolpyruvate carboxykinase (ATP) [Armatimonadota bacterium]